MLMERETVFFFSVCFFFYFFLFFLFNFFSFLSFFYFLGVSFFSLYCFFWLLHKMLVFQHLFSAVPMMSRSLWLLLFVCRTQMAMNSLRPIRAPLARTSSWSWKQVSTLELEALQDTIWVFGLTPTVDRQRLTTIIA
jgi:hypothetical protein